MSRLSPIALGALACVALVAAPVAVAAPTTETCTAASPQVVGGKVTAKLSSSNVDRCRPSSRPASTASA
jgi:hypothetical protein